MPYVPTSDEARRLRHAIDLARFSEGERVAWLVAFISLVVLEVVLLTGATWAGAVGAVGGFLFLYWRLRGGHLVGRVPAELRGLFGIDLRRREQRAFTGLMFVHVLTGRNPLVPRSATEHDPYAAWLRSSGQVKEPAPEEAESA